MDIDFVAWAAIIGALLPLVISTFKQNTWSTQVKKYVAVAVSAVAAVVYTGAAEGWDIASLGDFWSYIIASFAGIYAIAQTTYLGFWEDSAIEVRLSSTGDRTT